MNKNSTLGLIFCLRKDKLNKNGEAPIYLRITVDGKRAYLSTNRSIHPEKWDGDKVRGTTEDVRIFNHYLSTLISKAYKFHTRLLEKEKEITAESLRNAILGNDERKYSLIEVFKYHNEQMRQKVGIDFAKGTMLRYKITLQHVQNFLQSEYGISDLKLKDLTYKFITDFEHYLKTSHKTNYDSTMKSKCGHNATLKYIRNFRKIINMAVANDWLDKDPFLKFKAKQQDTKFIYLTTEELEVVKEKEIKISRLSLVRDLFVFSCYTGLAYVDLQKLSRNEIVIGIDGNKWIHTYRAKTEIKSHIPLLPEAIAIMDKYKDGAECEYRDKIFPVISNQKLNSYLKELADICGIEKNIVFHTGRKTFASTVLLNNDVPIESVSRMLGHSDIRITQKSYAKIFDKKVSADMMKLQEKLYGDKNKQQKFSVVV